MPSLAIPLARTIQQSYENKEQRILENRDKRRNSIYSLTRALVSVSKNIRKMDAIDAGYNRVYGEENKRGAFDQIGSILFGPGKTKDKYGLGSDVLSILGGLPETEDMKSLIEDIRSINK